MRLSIRRFGVVAAFVCAGAFAFASPSFADMVTLNASLSGAKEVPPNNSKGTGTVTATYNTSSKKLSWKGSYSGLSGPATAAHFHAGAPGKNGGVVIPIFAGKSAGSPFEGSKTLTAEQANAMLGGDWYVNVHTAEHKAGEIRGQLEKTK
ncbi:MAG TPA: CHRD domain-containing protein [Pseudolabrys sp.]|jgi:hypothetical protein|nr:CHRD domain-containing protein [Pseudolabrys sp.]